MADQASPGRVAIFVNEGAGSARSPRVRETVELVRRVLGADLHVTATRDQEVLLAWLEERIEPYRTAVIAGGDGSLGIAFNVAAPRGVTLGYIPAGFGNATAHLLGLPRRPAALATVLARGEARPFDLIRVDGHLALFAGAGWDAAVARRYASAGAKRLPGWAAAVIGSGGELVRRFPVRVEVDGALHHEGPMELAVVGTTPYYGRGLVVNPGAAAQDGAFALRVYSGPMPRLALEAARWIAHRPPAARSITGTHAVITTTDGSLLPLQTDGDHLGERLRWEIRLAPAAVRLIGAWSLPEM